MTQTVLVDKLLKNIDEQATIELAKSMIRIPSPRLHESELADWVATYMNSIGLETIIQMVEDEDIRSKNVVGRIRGNGVGSGKNLLLLGHLDVAAASFEPPFADRWTHDPLDPQIEGDWIYGWGAGNMKCGLAAILSAAKAIHDSGLEMEGDLTVACVMGETYGSMGTRKLLSLIENDEVSADMAVVPERTKLDLVTITIGNARARIEVEGKMRFRANGENSPIDHMVSLLYAMGPSYRLNQTLESWLSFEPHPELPGFPQIVVNSIENYADICAIDFDVRFVPGQTPTTIEEDIRNLLSHLASKDPSFKPTLLMPPRASLVNNKIPDEISKDETIVRRLAHWHEFVLGQKPYIGSGHRLGSPCDAAPLMLSGIKAITYGPGVTSIEQDPPDEKNSISETIAATKVFTLAAADLCGGR